MVYKLVYSKINLLNVKSVELRLFAETKGLQMIPLSTTVRTKVYELYLLESQESKTLIAESTNYQKAIYIMDSLAKGLEIPAENAYLKWRLAIRNRRKR